MTDSGQQEAILWQKKSAILSGGLADIIVGPSCSTSRHIAEATLRDAARLTYQPLKLLAHDMSCDYSELSVSQLAERFVSITFIDLHSLLASLPSWRPEVAQILQRAQEHIMSQISTTKPVISTRPDAPLIGEVSWYRGWECAYDRDGAYWGFDPWVAYLGGADVNCVEMTARTWEELLDEIDDHDKTEKVA